MQDLSNFEMSSFDWSVKYVVALVGSYVFKVGQAGLITHENLIPVTDFFAVDAENLL